MSFTILTVLVSLGVGISYWINRQFFATTVTINHVLLNESGTRYLVSWTETNRRNQVLLKKEFLVTDPGRDFMSTVDRDTGEVCGLGVIPRTRYYERIQKYFKKLETEIIIEESLDAIIKKHQSEEEFIAREQELRKKKAAFLAEKADNIKEMNRLRIRIGAPLLNEEQEMIAAEREFARYNHRYK